MFAGPSTGSDDRVRVLEEKNRELEDKVRVLEVKVDKCIMALDGVLTVMKKHSVDTQQTLEEIQAKDEEDSKSNIAEAKSKSGTKRKRDGVSGDATPPPKFDWTTRQHRTFYMKFPILNFMEVTMKRTSVHGDDFSIGNDSPLLRGQVTFDKSGLMTVWLQFKKNLSGAPGALQKERIRVRLVALSHDNNPDKDLGCEELVVDGKKDDWSKKCIHKNFSYPEVLRQLPKLIENNTLEFRYQIDIW